MFIDKVQLELDMENYVIFILLTNMVYGDVNPGSKQNATRREIIG
jgi:hypothetical protein